MCGEFRYFDYEFYDNFLNKIIRGFHSNTVVSREDIKQDMFLEILNIEEYVYNRKDRVNNEKNFIKFLIVKRLKNVINKAYRTINNNSNNIEITELAEYLSDDNENLLNSKIILNDLLERVKLSEDEINLLLGKRIENKRNERQKLLKKIRKNNLTV